MYMLVCRHTDGCSFGGSSFSKGQLVTTATGDAEVKALGQVRHLCDVYHNDASAANGKSGQEDGRIARRDATTRQVAADVP